MRCLIPLFVVVTCFVLASPAAAAIINGGFESPTALAPDWDEVDFDTDIFDQGVDDAAPHSGEWAAFFAHNGGRGAISQDEIDTPLATYILSFWLQNTVASPTPINSFDVEWNGEIVFTLTPNLSDFGYTQFSVRVTASGPEATLGFFARNDDGFFDLDDITLQADANGAVPEPASITLWSLATLGAASAYRRRRRFAAA